MHRSEPTIRQQEVIDTIQKYLSINGYPPSFRDIGKIVGMKSSSTVSGILTNLKKKGYVTWETGRPRTLKIIKVKENVPL